MRKDLNSKIAWTTWGLASKKNCAKYEKYIYSWFSNVLTGGEYE